jgi:hypothetical protein
MNPTTSVGRQYVWSMKQEQFLETAGRVGVDDAAARALYTALYTKPAAAHPLVDQTASYAERDTLSRLVQTLLYLGVLLVIGAHAWWSSQAYDADGFGGLLALTLAFQAGFLGAAWASARRGLPTLAAALATIFIFYTPLAVYAAERCLGVDLHRSYADFYPWISQGWAVMELVSIIVGLAVFARLRHPFLLLPVLLFGYFLTMDGTAHLAGSDSFGTLGPYVAAYGALCAVAGVALDYRGWRRFAFWPHVFAMLSALWAIEAWSGSPQAALIISGALGIGAGIWLGRVSYLVGGGIGLWAGITCLAPSPSTLIVSGLCLVGVAVWLSQASSPLRSWLASRSLPAPERR